MKIAFSNLAWAPKHDVEVRALLVANGISAIELAPTKIWPDINGVKDAELAAYRSFWNAAGIQIVALQSLLFNLPPANIFDSSGQILILERLKVVAHMAERLGAKTLVFGSPKQRLRGALAPKEAARLARDFFTRAAQVAASYDVRIGLEPNPHEYGCDFILNSREALDLIEAVGDPHFSLHLDTGCAALAGERPESIILSGEKVVHTHLSAFKLAVPAEDLFPAYKSLIKAGDSAGYRGFYSFEYLAPETLGQQLDAIRDCCARLLQS